MNRDNECNRLAQKVGELLTQQNSMLITAESCTGGWVAQALTSIAGSSHWFERGLVTYSNLAKQQLLGVTEATLAQYGAVSQQAAQEMAQGALAHSPAQIALAITGYAGPDSEHEQQSVGLVYFAWVGQQFPCQVAKIQFAGDRTSIRRQAVVFSLSGLNFILRNL